MVTKKRQAKCKRTHVLFGIPTTKLIFLNLTRQGHASTLPIQTSEPKVGPHAKQCQTGPHQHALRQRLGYPHQHLVSPRGGQCCVPIHFGTKHWLPMASSRCQWLALAAYSQAGIHPLPLSHGWCSTLDPSYGCQWPALTHNGSSSIKIFQPRVAQQIQCSCPCLGLEA